MLAVAGSRRVQAGRGVLADLEATEYIDPLIMQHLPFGTHSHYLQPWRSYLDTVPASRFLHGLGVVCAGGHATSTLSIAALARTAVTHARIEIPWGELDPERETHLRHEDGFRRVLAACRKAHVRPLLLLNGHQGLPAPAVQFEGVVLADATAGDRSAQISTSGTIVPGRTGISDQTEYWAAEMLIARVAGASMFFDKKLSKPLRAGQTVRLATLNYEPFGRLGDARTQATLAGWSRYVACVGRFANGILGQDGNCGFDLEVWNELSFGTAFLSIARYRETEAGEAREDAVWAAIVAATAKAVRDNAQVFAGCSIANGFASTVPWPGAAAQPAAVTALSKHPYPPRLSFPADERRNTAALDVAGATTAWVPRYEAFFPEYAATAIQTETIVRDMGPQTSEIYGMRHGSLSRPGNRVPVWLTEFGVNPQEAGVTDASRAGALKAKSMARAALFYINKGAERVYLYALGEADDTAYGLAPTGSAAGSTDPGTLACLSRIARVFGAGEGPSAFPMRQLGFRVHAAPGSDLQFTGDGTAANPDLRNIDMLAILPFQASATRFVIAVYFVTRDVRVAAPAEPVTMEIAGLRAVQATTAIYDPMRDSWMEAADMASLCGNIWRVRLQVSDAPRLLVMDEAPLRPSQPLRRESR